MAFVLLNHYRDILLHQPSMSEDLRMGDASKKFGWYYQDRETQ